MQPKPFSLLGRSTLEAVRMAVAAGITDWAGEWGVPQDSVSVQADRASDAAVTRTVGAPAWSHHLGLPTRGIWLAAHPDLLAELQRLMFVPDGTFGPQGDTHPHFAPAAAQIALDSFVASIAREALPGQDDIARCAGTEPGKACFARGSGAVLLTIKLGKQQCRLLLDHASVLEFCSMPDALAGLKPVSFRKALESVPVTLSLKAGATQIKLGSLVSLEVGDVIRLDASVDAPLSLSTPEGTLILDAYLGRVGNDMAVEVVGRK